ncbi:cytochrome P450 [Dactylonectria estremocensis]|uniref:Cytochrome P450 n=1 Tax=Dactylonectria estremocensis TaxID=1079267 RepID=A0A9P9IUQ0_9HYPO|nr:cytochrome P450 [Dactylonectria estremocensis]
MQKIVVCLIAVLIGVMCSLGKRFNTAGGQSPVTINAGQMALTVMFSFSKSTGPTRRPKPIPGIPYKHAAARSILSDVPSMMKWKKDTRETFSWMTEQCKRLNAPMAQVFVSPFSLPWVLVTDARECEDVLTRRSREFDRARFTTDVVQPILREHHFPFPSGSKQRAHRSLLSDLMTPAFLNEVAAPRLYDATMELLQLWLRKAALACGHPFAAEEDIANTALDTIWAASIELLTQRSTIDLPSKQDLPVVFPQAPIPYDVECIRTEINSIEVSLASPLPGLSYFFYLKLLSIWRAFRRKDLMLSDALKDSLGRLGSEEKCVGKATVRSAMGFVLRREFLQARKECRQPRLDSTVLKDELFGFLLAGHETTSTTLMWSMKLLTDHQQGRQPTFSEVTASKMPYLDAVIEEMLRCGGTAATQGRECLVEAELLGARLPKGTNVLFMTNGPSFITPAMPIDEKLRSQTCQGAKGKTPEWDPEHLSEFKLERWLSTNSEGVKSAYLEMRTVMTIIFWNVKLLPVPAELSTYRAVDSVAHAPQQCYIRLAPPLEELRVEGVL